MTILLGVDEDPRFEDVLGCLRWCVRIGPGDHVIVLHATPVVPWMPRAAESHADSGEAWRVEVENERSTADRVLSAAARLLAQWNIEAETLKGEGHPAREILRVAGERAADLIVVGARGKDQHGFLLGSVSQKVKALAQTDVLVVRPGAPVDPSRFRALLAVDGSPESTAAVASFVTKLNSERALAAATTILTEHGIKPAVEIRKGSPAPVVMAAAARHRAHVIVMGSRGISGLRGLVLGSVTQRVVRHGDTSVLIARTRPTNGAA